MAVASPQQQLFYTKSWRVVFDDFYLAGLIAADGYVSEREVRISTSSREYAEYVADIVRRCLGKAPKIEIGKGVLLLRIYDVSFGKILETKYGIPIGRKSSTIPLPLWLELPDIIDYLNGYFDGDGSITANKSGVTNGRWGPYISP